MNDLLFAQIKTEYDNFYREMLRKGKLPMRSTAKGFWNASISEEIYDAFRRIGLRKFNNFLDIGSGDGKVVLIASLFCKNAEGVEIDNLLHSRAVEVKNNLKINNAVFHNKDFFQHDFSEYDALFIAPDTPMERGLENKLLKEMKGWLIHYGHHFQPRFLKREHSFLVNGTLVSVYSRQKPSLHNPSLLHL
ncbi:hypothetical protein J4204_00625 [Candidatus Woesearchaeota archaeon]|nr:hypothetical protein [Candidatus Woesearchaeota archaeon]